MSAVSIASKRDAVKAAIIHERQEEGSMLCAQHCLNNLLQGQFFDAAGLADIAKQLDDVERSHLDINDTQWSERDTQSRNADETGFFSVSVLETALQVWGLSLTRWGSQEMIQYQERPEDQLAFVLNLESHWFCFRSFGIAGDVWFNLNSFLQQPTWVGSGYLGAMLDQAAREGYSVFVVRTTDEQERQYTPIVKQFRSSPADEAANQALTGIAGDADEEEDIRRAIEASLAAASQLGSSANVPRPGLSIPPPLSPSAIGSTRPPTFGESKRRRSRRQGDEDLQEALQASMRTRWRANFEGADDSESSGSLRRTGGTRETAITLGDENEDDISYGGNPSQARSPFLDPALRHHLMGGDDEDGLEELPQVALSMPVTWITRDSTPSAPQRQRTGARHEPIEIFDEDDEDIDESTLAARDRHAENLHRQFTGAARAFSQLQDRDYDDEDAELQRALAASMEQHINVGVGNNDAALRGDWLAGIDPEQQAKILEDITARASRNERGVNLDPHYRSPTPADVGRIAKMREEAKQKEREAREREERHSRGEFTPEPPSEKIRAGSNDDGDEGEDEEETPEEKPLSAEELRKIRLARFGG